MNRPLIVLMIQDSDAGFQFQLVYVLNHEVSLSWTNLFFLIKTFIDRKWYSTILLTNNKEYSFERKIIEAKWFKHFSLQITRHMCKTFYYMNDLKYRNAHLWNWITLYPRHIDFARANFIIIGHLFKVDLSKYRLWKWSNLVDLLCRNM